MTTTTANIAPARLTAAELAALSPEARLAAARSAARVFPKATLYFTGEFIGAVHKIEASNVKAYLGKYAQFDAAVYCEFTPKGCRKPRRITQATSTPSLLILEGHGHPDPETFFGDEEIRETEIGPVSVAKSRHLAHDDAWRNEFDAMIGRYLDSKPAVRVAADYRKHNPHR